MKISAEAADRNRELINKIQKRYEKEGKSKDLNPYETMVRNNTIEEVAQAIKKLKGFGIDTIDSLVVYIKGMKR